MFIRSKKSKLIIVLSVLVLIFSGCSASKSQVSMDTAEHVAPSYDEKAEYDMEYTNDSTGFGNTDYALQEIEEEPIDNSNNQSYESRKIIKSARVELETKEFDKTTNAITEKVKLLGGYIESSSIVGGRPINTDDFRDRVASFKLRIPEKSFEELLLDFNDIGNVIRIERGGQDITSEYFDSEARLKSLTIQEERLLEILKQADNVKDIIELERELSSVRYQIENLTGTLKKWDNLVSYSTIDVTVYEVREIKAPEPVTLKDRMVDGFNKSIKNIVKFTKELIVLISTLLPILFILLIIGLIVFFIGKKAIRRSSKNINAKRDKDEE